jgi:hypothetical protein
MKAHSSTLASKVFSLEENLKRLQNIVGSLISQVDPNNTVIASDPELLGQAGNNTDHPQTLANIQSDLSQYGLRSTSVGLGHEKIGDSKLDSGHTIENMSEIFAEKRPVTQPVPASPTSRKSSVLPRSKTAGFSVKKDKRLSRQSSLPLKSKSRQFVPTIPEEGQHVMDEQSEHGIQGVTREDTRDTRGEQGIEDVPQDKEDTQNETCEQQPKEGMTSDNDSESEGDIEDTIEQEIEAALSDPSDPQNTAYALRLGLERMQRWREEFQAAQENMRFEMEECRNYIQSLGEHFNVLKTERKNQVCFCVLFVHQ